MSEKKEMVVSGKSVGQQSPVAAPQAQASQVNANPDCRLGGKPAGK